MGLAAWLNTAWMLKCLPESRAFHRAVHKTASAQERLLKQILRDNRDTSFGRRFHFNRIRDPRQYQALVPPSRYEDYQDAIARIAAGEPRVLTQERVKLLEPTSGTTAGEKWIPYTTALQGQFQRAVAVWMADLLWQRPRVRGGRAYWSLSPALAHPRRTAGGIRIGFDSDAAYLGTLERLALTRLLIVPSGLADCQDLLAFRYCTLLALLAAEDLTLISVWNPTFLTALFAHLASWADHLCRDLADGTVCPPGSSRQLARTLGRPARAAAVTRLLGDFRQSGAGLEPLWPALALISCWTDAAAAWCLGEVRELFPSVEVQPKGLLATEGVVSFPLLGQPAPVLAIRSHFFEFEEAGTTGRVVLAHQVEVGGRYHVLLSTGGGLYRYQLHDEVEIVGRYAQCPLLRFRGKADRVSDLVGEKLAEAHVRAVLERVLVTGNGSPRFALVVPELGRPSRYVCYVQGPGVPDDLALARRQVQAGLEENPYYRHAVALGQLATLEISVLPENGPPAWQLYEACLLERGMKLGDIKPAALETWTGWPARIAAVYT